VGGGAVGKAPFSKSSAARAWAYGLDGSLAFGENEMALEAAKVAMKEVVIKLRVRRLKEGGFVATCREVPGLVAQGRTVVEAVEIAQDVARKIAEICVENGQPLPAALRQRGRSGSELRVPVAVP
jgi:predicted RNase H-like HicB family nuclease